MMVEVHDRPSLIAASLAYDAEQAAREKEFQANYQRFLKKTKPRTPVDIAWVRRQLEPWKYSTSLPGRILPGLYWGENWRLTTGYIPIERRFELTHHRFNEIYSAGDKTPRRDMVEVK